MILNDDVLYCAMSSSAVSYQRFLGAVRRHAAITAAITACGGDLRKARAYSRHASLETVARYDDNRSDHAGQVAAVVDGLAD
jgi:hypothetical protein